MKKIISVLFILISISSSYSLEEKDSSKPQYNKVKYISKYNTNLDKNIIECYFDEKDNTFTYKTKDIIIKKYQYKTKADFIKERQVIGLTLYTSRISYNKDKIIGTCNFFYDDESRLNKELSNDMSTIWNNWDLKKRNTTGISEMAGISENIILDVSYNDNLKIATCFASYPESIIKKHPYLPIVIINEYDNYNNVISLFIKNSKGESYKKIINVISYIEIE
jgi:hypothetical protein